MNYVNFHNLKPGDKIVAPKSWLKLVQHHVIYLGQNYSGQDLIAENAVGMHVRIITADQFFAENPEITRIERFTGSNADRKVAIERALKKLGQRYDLINFNCEHFANYVQTGEIKSPQVGWGLLALGVLAAVLIFAD
jgi:Lecithin retinol acyltransferase